MGQFLTPPRSEPQGVPHDRAAVAVADEMVGPRWLARFEPPGVLSLQLHEAIEKTVPCIRRSFSLLSPDQANNRRLQTRRFGRSHRKGFFPSTVQPTRRASSVRVAHGIAAHFVRPALSVTEKKGIQFSDEIAVGLPPRRLAEGIQRVSRAVVIIPVGEGPVDEDNGVVRRLHGHLEIQLA